MTRKICVVTGSRADFGYLVEVLRELQRHGGFEIQIIATGSHLSDAFGQTEDVITDSGFFVSARVPILGDGDRPLDTVEATGRAVIGIGAALEKLAPELVVVMGDRYEIFAAAQAAFLLGLPIAHIAGGDITEGAFDDGLRHAITKLSHLHFVTNADAARRVRQMGEPAGRVFQFGSPGLDALRKTPLLTRTEFAAQTGFVFRETNLLVTFHPVTEQPGEAVHQFNELLAALEEFPDAGILFTYPNADTEGRGLAARLEEFVRSHPGRICAVKNLGMQRYATALAEADAVVGNSSSGLYEAPSFGTPTVNVGDRQKGRLQGNSVFNCPPARDAIAESIRQALAFDGATAVNPYGDGRAAPQIVNVLANISDWRALRRKTFQLYEN